MAIKSFTRSTIENNIFYRSMLAGNTAYEPSYEDVLAEEILTSSQASVTFSGLDTLAAGYQHLQIRIVARSNRGSTISDMDLRFNGDSGTNYTWHYMRGTGTDYESAGTGGLDSVRMYQTLTGSTNTSNSFAATVLDILDPFETTKHTTVRFLSGFTGSLNRVLIESGSWMNTAAITSITLDEYYGASFVTGSSFTLIGVK